MSDVLSSMLHSDESRVLEMSRDEDIALYVGISKIEEHSLRFTIFLMKHLEKTWYFFRRLSWNYIELTSIGYIKIDSF